MKKLRKPRTTGHSMNIDGVSHINGHPFRCDTIAEAKIHSRLVDNKCPACGHSTCTCKSGE